MKRGLSIRRIKAQRDGAVEMGRLIKRELSGVKGFDHRILHEAIETILTHNFPDPKTRADDHD